MLTRSSSCHQYNTVLAGILSTERIACKPTTPVGPITTQMLWQSQRDCHWTLEAWRHALLYDNLTVCGPSRHSACHTPVATQTLSHAVNVVTHLTGTSNNMKFVHWPLLGGAVTFGVARARAHLRPRCTKCNSPPMVPSTASVPITVLLYNCPWLCSFNVPVKGLIRTWGTRTKDKHFHKYSLRCEWISLISPITNHAEYKGKEIGNESLSIPMHQRDLPIYK